MAYSLAYKPDLSQAQSLIQQIRGIGDWQGLRFYTETTDERNFRNGKSDKHNIDLNFGVMVEIRVDGQIGYSGTSDLSSEGVRKAAERAFKIAKASAKLGVHSFQDQVRPSVKGHYRSPHFQGLDKESIVELVQTLQTATEKLKVSDKIVNTTAFARLVETQILYLTSSGAEIDQSFFMLGTGLSATSQEGSDTQTRSDKGFGARCNQIGLEGLDKNEMFKTCEQLGKEAVELLSADNCPTDSRHLLLSPEQMLMQIHESIGHPLELDRILGDERNFAGWSFVRPENFGTLQYGSKLMNVTFDPHVPGQFASYAFDDGGAPAEKQHLIKDGLLVRGLGGLESQTRSKLPGVSNFRASSWARAPIDRMANINLEPGSSSMKEMIEKTEKGVLMQANHSWSIDDYRRKFQFGCEIGHLIEDGRLTKIVKNPGYRGVTVPFWNNLVAVGSPQELEMYGTPYCGKGEPSQIIRVGHSSPPCLFKDIEVFGGGQ
jgi:predicted Zn-dependent protease